MIIKRQKKFTFASDQAKRDLRSFLVNDSLRHSDLDEKELEVFREGLDRLGRKTADGKGTKSLPRGFDKVLTKIGLPQSVVSQVPHWFKQQDSEVQDRYKKILEARGGKPLTEAGVGARTHAILDKYAYSQILDDQISRRPLSSEEDLRKQKEKIDSLGIGGSVTFDRTRPSEYAELSNSINVDPSNSDSSTLPHETGHKIDYSVKKTPRVRWGTNGKDDGMITWGCFNEIGNEVAANFYGRDVNKKIGASEGELMEFDRKRVIPMKSYQLNLLDPEKRT